MSLVSPPPSSAYVQPQGSDDDRMRLAIFEQGIGNTPLMLFGMDEELRYTQIVNTQSPWAAEDMVGRTDGDLLSPAEAEPIMQMKRRVLATGNSESLVIDITLDRQRYWYEVNIVRADLGSGCALIGTALDVSEKRRREAMLKALLREVSHRSKNLLAMVVSIASQTSRHSLDLPTFLSRFTGRIQSISRSQDAITGSDWRGATLAELIETQVVSLLDDDRQLISRVGPDLQFTPNAALHVGLALHELTTNALAHGALAKDGGRVTIRVEPVGPSGHDTPAVLRWCEHGAEGYVPFSRESFGMSTLRRIVPAAVSGKGEIGFEGSDLIYALTIDSSQFERLHDS